MYSCIKRIVIIWQGETIAFITNQIICCDRCGVTYLQKILNLINCFDGYSSSLSGKFLMLYESEYPRGNTPNVYKDWLFPLDNKEAVLAILTYKNTPVETTSKYEQLRNQRAVVQRTRNIYNQTLFTSACDTCAYFYLIHLSIQKTGT
ncbi:unnamed protein product [Rotaria socialis]